MNNTSAQPLCAFSSRYFNVAVRNAVLLMVVALLVSAFMPGRLHAQSRVIVVPNTPTVADVDKHLAELPSASSLSESERAAVAEFYRQSREVLVQAEQDIELTRQMRDSEQAAPQKIAEIQGRLNEMLPTVDARRYESHDLDALQDELRKYRVERDQLQVRLGQIRQTVEAFNSTLPRTLRERYAAAERDLERALGLAEVDELSSAQAVPRARNFVRLARRRALAASAERLRTEMLTRDARLAVASARRDLLGRELGLAQSVVSVLEGMVGQKQAAEAQSSQLQAQRTEAKLQDKHPVVQRAASENTALANELARVISFQGELAAQLAGSEQRLQRLEEDYQGGQQRVTLAGQSRVLGQTLSEQRRSLPNLRSVRGKAREREDALAKVGLAQLRIDEALQKAVDRVAYVDDLIRQSLPAGAVAMDAVERGRLERQLAPLLADRRELLQKLSATYLAQLKLLGELGFSEQRLVTRANEYAAFLDQKLLWIPSANPLGLDTLHNIVPAALWLIDAGNLSQLVRAVREQIVEQPLTITLLLVGVWVLIRIRGNLRRQLAATAKSVRHVYSDGYIQTFICAGATLMLAMPSALVVAFFGWRLAAYGDGNTYVYAVASGLSAMALPLFLLRLFHYILAADGLGVAHFGWVEAIAAQMRRYLNVLVFLVVPGTFVLRVMDAQPVFEYGASLGRCAFFVVVLAIAWMGHRLFHPSTGTLQHYLMEVSNRWIGRLRHVWYAITVGIPVSIGAVAAYGYYYTALRLHEHQVATIRLVIGCVLLFHFLLRALVIARRRLALSKTDTAPTPEMSADGSPVHFDVPNIDINTIDTQTRSLAHVLISWTAIVGFYLIWADVLPALAILDEVVLWDSTSSVDGVLSVQHITLASLCLAAVFGIVFFVAARNLPGVLEMLVLQRLPVDAGGRYAITTLSQYVIVTIGFMFIIQSLGVGWGQVQWLVAALGVGLGFGLQEIFANFISGIIILFERPVRIGDTVTLGELTGTVSRIRIRATTITDWDNKEIIIPNKSFITDKLINWTLSDSILRVIIPVGVAYGTDTRAAHAIIWDIARSNPRVLREPQSQLFFVGFGDSSLNFELRVFVGELSDKLKVTHELNMAINEAFNEHGIVIPFPQRDVHIRAATPIAVDLPPQPAADDDASGSSADESGDGDKEPR